MREHPPRTPTAHQVEDGVDHFPFAIFGRTTQLRGPLNQRLQKGPFGIREIAWIAFPHS